MKLLRGLLLSAVAGVFFCLGCAEPNRGAPLRSPSIDYGPPPPTTSDGQVVGVDRKAPEDTLHAGASSGGLAPGWSVQEGRFAYDPSQQVGGALFPELSHEHHEKKPQKKPAGAR